MKQQKIIMAIVVALSCIGVSLSSSVLAESSWYNEINNVTSDSKLNLSDTAISAKIKDTLSSNSSINDEYLSIRTEFGHVSVSGFVKNKEQEAQILQIIKKVDGVKSVDSSVNIQS